MLLWQYVAEAVRRKRIGLDADAARRWLARHREFADVGPDGELYFDARRFDVSADWTDWQAHCYAVSWLAAERGRSRPHARRMPLAVSECLDQVIGRTRNWLTEDWVRQQNGEGARVQIRFTNASGAVAAFHITGRFDDFVTFWQAVVVSYFMPDAALSASVCQECGEPLPRGKSGRTSRARHCDRCRLAVWRKDNAERQREIWREAKQEERRRSRSKLPK